MQTGKTDYELVCVVVRTVKRLRKGQERAETWWERL